MATVKLSKRVLGKIEGILTGINPEVDFETFHEIMFLIYAETCGSKYGFELVDNWYSKCSEYPGKEQLANEWRMYKDDEMRTYGMAGLMCYVEPDEEVKPIAPATKKQKSKK